MHRHRGQADRSPKEEGSANGRANSKDDPLPDQINWNNWWPFKRATGQALRQLNKKPQPDWEEALF